MKAQGKFILIVTIILIAAFSRLIPHLPNFTPIAAIALFGGAMISNRFLAFFVPLAAMLLSDLAIELTTGFGFHASMWAVYLAFTLIVFTGRLLGNTITAGRVTGISLASSVLFFIITNFGAWIVSPFYPATGSGLMTAYVAGIPFLGYTVLGDLFYCTLLFGTYLLLERRFVLKPIKG